jgi:hypothetical protein
VLIDQGERNMIRKDADSEITESTHATHLETRASGDPIRLFDTERT